MPDKKMTVKEMEEARPARTEAELISEAKQSFPPQAVDAVLATLNSFARIREWDYTLKHVVCMSLLGGLRTAGVLSFPDSKENEKDG